MKHISRTRREGAWRGDFLEYGTRLGNPAVRPSMSGAGCRLFSGASDVSCPEDGGNQGLVARLCGGIDGLE